MGTLYVMTLNVSLTFPCSKNEWDRLKTSSLNKIKSDRTRSCIINKTVGIVCLARRKHVRKKIERYSPWVSKCRIWILEVNTLVIKKMIRNRKKSKQGWPWLRQLFSQHQKRDIFYVQYLQAEVISSNTENNFFFTKKSLSIKTHLPYRISSNNSRPSINRPPLTEMLIIIAPTPPLSPSSLPFISSLSRWSAIRFSKTDQGRFKLWKLIKELN